VGFGASLWIFLFHFIIFFVCVNSLEDQLLIMWNVGENSRCHIEAKQWLHLMVNEKIPTLKEEKNLKTCWHLHSSCEKSPPVLNGLKCTKWGGLIYCQIQCKIMSNKHLFSLKKHPFLSKHNLFWHIKKSWLSRLTN
jgi:hypothetical protein